jgi:thymidine kinase
MQPHDFIIYCGPMFSEKTTKLLSYIERCKYQGRKTITFKPAVDARYSEDEIVTHQGSKIKAISVETGSDILKYLSESDEIFDTVCVDEQFMIKGSSHALIWLFKNGFSIVVSTLDLSSLCDSFSEVERILPYATKIEKQTSVCTICGNDARYTYKKIDNDDIICVGGAESYEPRCFQHHPLMLGET